MRYKPKTKPFKHQARATLRAVKHRNYALFMEPRTGKSKAALDAVGILALKGEVKRVLILAPKVSLEVWDGQIKQHFPLPAELETYDEEWSYNAPPRLRQGATDDEAKAPTVSFYLCNYERFRWRSRKGKRWIYRYGEEVERWAPDLVICDESHRLKRAGGVTAQLAWRMVSRCRRNRHKSIRPELPDRPYVFLLSGTPNPKGWIDLFAQFRILDPSIFGTNKADFEDEHVVYGKDALKYTILKYRNVGRLKSALKRHAFTCTAEEAGLAGTVFFESLHCELPPKARRIYDEMAEEFITELESGEVIRAANPGVKRLRMAQITGGFTTDGQEIHSAKLDKAGEYLGLLFEQGEKVVCYASYLPEVHAIQKMAKHVGYQSYSLHGGTKKRDRSAAVNALQNSKRPTCLTVQVQSGSVSLEFSAAAEVLFYSPPDGWENYFGCYQRVLGPNQHRPVRVTHILAAGTVDISKVYGLQNKEDQHRLLYKDPRRYLYGLV